MDSSLTVSQTHLPCPPCGKMGLQPWTVVVAINSGGNNGNDNNNITSLILVNDFLHHARTY